MGKKLDFENGEPVEQHPEDCECERCSGESESEDDE